ncbi:MAG: hypothetical protein LBV75_02250 [Paludibacter sp.]|jgi:hypothetical protein|nr:hypothetical protein [Paludibacter sp.]
MQNLRLILFFVSLVFSNIVFAQTPVAQHYVACSGAKVKVGFVHTSGINFYWYYAASGGSPFESNSDDVTLEKDNSTIQTVYAEPHNGSTILPRIAIDIYLSNYCGSTYPNACTASGTVLFREDFGGNSPSDLPIKATGIPQCNYIYSLDLQQKGTYTIAKQNPATYSSWYTVDDHTYPNDITRGYLFAADASNDAGQFYEYQINNLCAGTTLTFSLWLMSLKNVNDNSSRHKTNQIFRLEDLSANVLCEYFTGDVPDVTPQWQNYGFDFTIPSGISSVVLRIINNGEGSSGNDFVMDDIEIFLCTPSVDISNANITVCEPADTALAINFENNGTFVEPLEYQWFYSADSIVWTNFTDNDNVLNLLATTAPYAGFYRVAVASAGNIESVNCRALSQPIKVQLAEQKLIEISDSICPAENYQFYEQTLNSSGVYTHYLANNSGCDTIVTLNLALKPNLLREYSDTICQGENYVFGDLTLTATGSYSTIIQNQNSCDSVITLHLFAKECQAPPCFEIADVSLPEICANNNFFDIPLQITANQNNSPSNYNLIFTDKAVNAGFINRQGEFLANNFVVPVNIPDSIYPDKYSLTLEISNQYCSKTLDIQFTILYPNSVFIQKWDDVISLTNKKYNGGYDFTAYQWYRNGEILTGETRSYIYLAKQNLSADDNYSVLIQRPDGSQLFSCPFVPHQAKNPITIYPTMLYEGENIIINNAPDNAIARFWTTTGILFNATPLTSLLNKINAPDKKGVYLLEILSNDNQKIERIVVK